MTGTVVKEAYGDVAEWRYVRSFVGNSVDFSSREELELWLAARGLEIGDKVIHTYRAGDVVPKGAWPYGGGRPVPLYRTVWSVVRSGKEGA